MILIVAAPGDDHVAAVAPELRRRGAAVLHLDVAELPGRAELSVSHEPGRRASAVLRVRDVAVDLREVSAVWSRRWRRPRPHDEVIDPELREYVARETADVWTGATELLDCVWLPAPRWKELRAGYKTLQLETAAELGFEIPATLVTNRPDDVLAFHRRHDGGVISKTVHNKLFPAGDDERYRAHVLTEVVANRDLADRDAIRYCPVAIQPYVEKRIELRITVVGDRVFPVEIHSQWTNHTRRDWRRGDYHHARYAVHDLPRRLARRSIALVKRLGLTFGAIDMILTPDGRYVFLEVNPDGDWLWMERTTGVPIGSAIADLLLAREGKGRRRRVFADPPPPPAAPAEPSAAVLRLPLASSPRAPRGIPPAVDRAIAATLRYLVGAARAGLPPVDAAERFGRLAKRHGTTDPRLVWEIDGALGGVHYDVLLRLAGAGTLSLAFSPEDGVPWALRHAHHARESDLVRVNGRTLNMQTVMGYLDGIWNDAALVERLVDGCLVREAVDAHGIDASADEVRSAVRGFRRERGLRSRRALAAWLRRRGWTPHDLEHESRRQVIATKLRAAIAAGRIRAYFEQHRPELDTATIVRVTADRHAAIAIARQSRAGECGFSRAVAAALEAGEAAAARTERVYRRDLPPKHARAIFRARPGAVIGPLAAAEGYDVVRVLRITAARLDPPTSDVIAEIVFDEWLEARRAEATVEWFWGDAERAPPRTRMPGASR